MVCLKLNMILFLLIDDLILIYIIIPRLPSRGAGDMETHSARPSVQMSLSRRYLSSLETDETIQLDRIYTKAVPREVIFEIFEKKM